MNTCPECHAPFSRRDALLRHYKHKHANETEPDDEFMKKQESCSLKHPFTMMVSGPTSCGKTYLVSRLLQERRISPTPQRIVWLYKRWQPLYDVVKETVTPRVEFVKGIPFDLEEDDYLDPTINNLIVLDDLMSVSGKDSRINDLFTEGSHHRNLSVIAVNQNLYYHKDPTQRRNCHYLALFNNPIDQQQILTLARQMYPTDQKYFLRRFNEATEVPYGHLLVDLKSDTPNKERLRINGLRETSSEKNDDRLHAPSNEPSRIDDERLDLPDVEEAEEIDDTVPQRGMGVGEDVGGDRSCHETNEPESSVWRKLFMPQVIADVKGEMDSRVDRRVEMGEKSTEANARAYNEYLPEIRRRLLQQFTDFMLKVKTLEKDPIARQIMDTAAKLRIEYRMDEEEALKKAGEFRFYLMENILPRVDEDNMDIDE